MPMDLPPQLQERITCSIAAAVQYGIPANIMLAVAEKEGGKAGQWVRNANGTHDVGPLQFNTAYLRQLSKYGIAPGDVAAAGCYPYELAAWRLRMHIKQDTGDLWRRCSNYHSRNAQLNEIYRVDLVQRSKLWAEWIESRFTVRGYVEENTSLLYSDQKHPREHSVRVPLRQAYSHSVIKVLYQPRAIANHPRR
ncbi:hypothetical protein [Duganella phyllosphaerae]|uniref:Transglycosylase SLT domain protein n=1 Tax=Duganella phyllosphaerae TaxID=762836 RepID=A0A1E7WG30_9BURK|nr:hypothetical protein [Duganella phyllosphaerae]OEZ97388.1 transglycosylase SLT domain protein [Duganella phyllosphaerae]